MYIYIYYPAKLFVAFLVLLFLALYLDNFFSKQSQDFKSNQIKFISLKNSIQYTSGIKAVSRNSKAKVVLTAVLDRPTNITRLHINY